MKVIVAPRARQAINEIWDYWATRASDRVADGQVSRIWGGIDLLGEQPLLGRAVPAIELGLRVVQAGKYLIYHQQRSGKVVVLKVVSGEREQRRAMLGGDG